MKKILIFMKIIRCLLNLIDCGLLQEREIMVSDIPNYQYISLFNAMISLGELVDFNI